MVTPTAIKKSGYKVLQLVYPAAWNITGGISPPRPISGEVKLGQTRIVGSDWSGGIVVHLTQTLTHNAGSRRRARE